MAALAAKTHNKSGQGTLGRSERMAAVVHSAIHRTKIDFGVICGLRTIEEQRELVKSGASQTMKSKHIDGLAVDLMAYVGPRGSWELNPAGEGADGRAAAAALASSWARSDSFSARASAEAAVLARRMQTPF